MENSITDIRLAGVVEESFTDGTGIRYTIFTQGCAHHCYKCQNPETWDFSSGYAKNIKELVDEILSNPMLDGVTFSGGDPLYQPQQVLEIIKQLKSRSNLNIWLYTGFTYEECLADPDKLSVLNQLDILVDGEYEDENRCLELRFRGSTNQRIIDVQESLKSKQVIIAISD